MSMTKHFTDENWQLEVIETSKIKPVLVDFYASWCGPCQIQGPIIEELADDFGEKAAIGKLNTEEAMKTAQDYGVMSIPTLLLFKNGETVKTYVGVQWKDALAKDIQALV